jgi:hypothetical protein
MWDRSAEIAAVEANRSAVVACEGVELDAQTTKQSAL